MLRQQIFSCTSLSNAFSEEFSCYDGTGVEVKSGEPCPVEAGQGRILHLSQCEILHRLVLVRSRRTKGMTVFTYMSLSMERSLFSEHFLLKSFLRYSLTWCLMTNLSYPTAGKMAVSTSMDIDAIINQRNILRLSYCYYEDESEEDLPANVADNGKPKSQAACENPPATQNATSARPDSAASKKKVKIVEPEKDVKTVEEDDSSEDDFGADFSEDELDSDEDEDGDSESGESDTEDDDEEEETPRKVELSKKRPAVSATATQGPDKKAKFITPQKTETKKGGGHVDTPYPSKQAGKTPANQSKQQTPKPAGSHPCKSCNRSFNSENALDSHTKAKHTPGK
ncbi:hypothetical protein RHGRI_007064 [Rhododendron griersonianum]|uniref:C2H2-type domain-containing protein n=1 Tax=Rhododendron griersonianum TaxID=479676 RepID=A0AAV6KVW4_9ERIC|nr:hypothetical protein RHGRI_007064 [Rhododendron griersonianum]